MNVSPANPSSADGATRTSAVTSILSAIVFREILKPLTAALGPVGDALSDRVADSVLGWPKT